MSNFKEKVKVKCEMAKEYVKEYKTELAVGIYVGVCASISMIVGYNHGRKDGFIQGREAQKEYDVAVITDALEMNKFLNNYDNEEDK